jgi:hypothetical protein
MRRLRLSWSEHLTSDFFLVAVFLECREGELGHRGIVMAKVIEFYIPKNYHKNQRWSARDERGRVIEFSLPKKSA